MGTWDKTKPQLTTNMALTPNLYAQNWDAIEDIIGESHYIFSSPLSGRHAPDQMPTMYSGATAAITGLSAPSGTLAQDITLGVHKVYHDGSWQQVNMLAHSEVHAYRSADYTITTGVTATIPFDTEVYDNLSEYDNGTYCFVAAASGFYYVRPHCSFTAVGGVTITMSIAHYNSADELQGTINTYKLVPSSDEASSGVLGLVDMVAGDKIYIHVSHDYSSSVILEGGIDRNFLNIYRVC